MANEELIMHAREFLATPNLGRDMARELNKALAYMWELADMAEVAEARVKELEAGEWEYAQAVIADDEGGLYLGKSFGDDPTRALDEGYVLVRRHVGPWVPVESEGE